MYGVTCAICLVKKGESNKWWVLFHGEFDILIRPLEEVLHEEKKGTEQFYLCGEGCLCRKLSAILMPKFVRISARQSADEGRGSSANLRSSGLRNGIGNTPAISSVQPFPLPGIVGLRKYVERILPVTVGSSQMTAPSIFATKPREGGVIGERIKISGRIESEEALYVRGEVAGSLEMPAHHLTVGHNATLRAKVWAKEVETFGVIEGDVTADKIVIRKKARLLGNIRTLVLVIEEGGCFEGKSQVGLLTCL